MSRFSVFGDVHVVEAFRVLPWFFLRGDGVYRRQVSSGRVRMNGVYRVPGRRLEAFRCERTKGEGVVTARVAV